MMPFSFSPCGPKEKGIRIYEFSTGTVMPARLAVDPIMITFPAGLNRAGSYHNAR
jgi:hypothetical protein